VKELISANLASSQSKIAAEASGMDAADVMNGSRLQAAESGGVLLIQQRGADGIEARCYLCLRARRLRDCPFLLAPAANFKSRF
jgi:hypothetical protein